MTESLSPDPYILIMTGAGLLIALVAWLPLALKRLPLSLPIVCIGIGVAVFLLPQVTLRPLPYLYPDITERFAEFVVIIALMGAGLKIDRPFGWHQWSITWRLLAITMPLGILAITGLGIAALGLPLAVALLLAASLAPTDPVLAADVQVGPPKTGDEDEVRFGLTSEAGLNDGAAFPFVHLAILLAVAAPAGEPWLTEWLSYRVLWEIVGGIAGGWLVGRVFGWLTFHIPAESKLARTGDGLIALSATFVSYGLTEIFHVYGFLAVFVTALTFRSAHRDHEFQDEMHAITEQIERLAMMVLLILFGGALVSGLLTPITWMDGAVALVILLIVRPLTGWIGLLGCSGDRGEKLTLSFFGIRGVGSIYYLAYGINHMPVGDAAHLWAIVGLIVLFSILLHGLTVTPIMRSLDERRGVDPDAKRVAPPGLQGPAS
ncbi:MULTISPECIES: cation:proton antiporter [unclassified Sphingomonas]|uniref:cation:proton antiporter n=1 Tax=unclassified Sphingomonas TaxID=196159 RepID=UPI0006FEF872|nr:MULTISPECIES: cation:proton antiporter [unclassified Sphingomonas]KQM24798.1 cation transporter [Sphingomonas sp. Leaf9]KQM42456.1 cation transporter [Sphingomonas sp. Leaf11]